MNIKILNQYAKVPTQGSDWAAGYDLYAAIPEDHIMIPPHSTKKIGTGLAVEIPVNAFGGIFARSGLASKMGLRPANCVGRLMPTINWVKSVKALWGQANTEVIN